MAPAKKNTVKFTAPEGVTGIGLASHNYVVKNGAIEVPAEDLSEVVNDLIGSGFVDTRDAVEEPAEETPAEPEAQPEEE